MLFVALCSTVAIALEDPGFVLTTHMYETPEEYFDGLHRDQLLELLGGNSALNDMDYEPGDFTATLLVPDTYEAGEGWGVYVHVAAGGDGGPRDGWSDVLAEHKLIYIGPNGIGNGQNSSIRIGVALDALATVQDGWDVDPDRFVIGGFSGGAAVGTMIGTHYPDLFIGTVDMCRAVMWELHEISTIDGAAFGMGEVDHLDPDGLPSIQNGHRFAFISGERDILPSGDDQFSNYEGILKGMGDWWARDLRTRMWDVPEMAHQLAPAEPFSMALNWVLTCEDDGSYPARFDSDHAPPLTPVATPEETPPAACDAVVDDDVVAGDDDSQEKGCGCSATTSSAGWLFLPLFLVMCLRRAAR